MLGMAPLSGLADEVANLRIVAQVAKEQVAAAEAAANVKKQELGKKYVLALTSLEKSLASSGNLDAIVHLREERESVEKSGSTTSHADKALVEVRDKFLKGLAGIDEEFKAAHAKVVASFVKMTRDQETSLTKSIKVDEALAVRKEGEKLLQEINGGATTEAAPVANGSSLFAEETPKADMLAPASMEQVFEEATRLADMPKLKALDAIEAPTEKPAVVPTPFVENRWMASLTVPTGKVKLKSKVTIGDRAKKSQPLVVVSPGSSWMAGDAKSIDLSFGNFVASKCRFSEMHFNADLSCVFYYQSCYFNSCQFAKGGVWYGSDLAGKFYFENCILKGNLASKLNTVDTGFRMQNCVFTDMDLPTYRYRNKRQPADFVNEKWLRVNNCRFVKCKVPLSFLMLTRDCIFENCSLVEDADLSNQDDPAVNPKPIEVTVYLKACRVSLGTLPKNVIVTQKADSELKGAVIPTVSSLTSLIGVGS